MTNDEAIKILDTIPTKGDEVDAIEMAIEALEETKPSGTYQCFHCGQRTVIWDADFDFEDYCMEGEGIVHDCHCTNCGARIQYFIDIDDREEQEDGKDVDESE